MVGLVVCSTPRGTILILGSAFFAIWPGCVNTIVVNYWFSVKRPWCSGYTEAQQVSKTGRRRAPENNDLLVFSHPVTTLSDPLSKKTPESRKTVRENKAKPAVSDSASRPFRTLFAIDPRSLAVFRVVLGALLLFDLAIRATDLAGMYTDQGMFSRAEICYRVTTPWNWSLHFANGTAGYQAFLFGMAALTGVALLLGIQTGFAAVASWLLLISLHHRVPPILSGADILLRMLLFWGMFLPLGQVWSLDARFRSNQPGKSQSQSPVFSVASTAALLQMALMYLASAIFKTNASWFEGEVIRGSLAHDFYGKPLGAYLLNFPSMLKLVTWGVLGLEWIGPVLLFIPKRSSMFRLIAIAGLFAMHLGIAILLEVDLFSPVAMAGLLLFLPAEFWNSRPFRRFRLSNPPAVAQPLAANPTRRHRQLAFASQAICLVALVYVVIVNLNSLGARAGTEVPATKPGFFRTACGLGQKWNMFDEAPSRDGWYVARAVLKDGSEVDLLRHGAPTIWTHPSNPAAIYPNFRWRKLFREMAYEDVFGYQVFREPVARYLCREWNRNNPAEKQVLRMELFFCMESDSKVVPDSKAKSISREVLASIDGNS